MVTPLNRLSQLQQAINAYRNALLTADDAALGVLQRSYLPSQERLAALINDLVAQVSADGIITATEASTLGRAQELLRQVEAEVTRLANVAGQVVPQTQAEAVSQAIERARVLTLAQSIDVATAARNAVGWTQLNPNAVADLVGSLSDGSPLDAWLQEFVSDSVQVVKDTLIDGVARGINAGDLGRALAQATDLPLHRALNLSRTTVLDSYRSASIRSFQANESILSGWTWISAHDARVCVACLSKSGHDFPLTTSFMPSHNRCRCAPAPKLKNDSLNSRLETGQEWFDKQPEKFRRESFPVALRPEYDAGRITLADMAYLQHDATWGDSYQTATITQARANAARRSGGSKIAAGG